MKLKKFQIGYVLIGGVLYISTVLIVSFILPFLGNLKFTALDSPASFFLIFFTTLAITRYHLFNIKIILTELLVGAMAIILVVLPFLMPNFPLKALTSGVFLLFCIFGYYLIKATHKEEATRKRAESLAEGLKKLDEAKTVFINTAAHDLRTPLTELSWGLSSIQRGIYGDFQKEYPKKAQEILSKLQNSTKRLSEIIESLLSVARIQQQRITYKKEKVNLQSLIQEIMDSLELTFHRKNLDFETNLCQKPLNLIADKIKLKEAIFNLIDNAIKYTKQGQITVNLEQANQKAIIKIQDTGIGMRKEEINSLFQPFSRSDSAIHTHTEGKGLGLFIAKKFIEDHQGTIRAYSQGKDKGSIFVVELPAGT